MAEARQTITMEEYFVVVSDSVSEEFLRKGIEREPQGITCDQLCEHEIDACVLTYLDNHGMCVNPACWARTDYYISEKFKKGDITFKVFVGKRD